MKAYFTRKPINIEAVVKNAEYAKAEGMLPTEVKPIAKVTLNQEEYTAFCRDPLKDWSFLAPHADISMFRGEDEAYCVVIECPNMISLAVCCEGYTYGRYVGCLVSPFDLKILANRIQQAINAGFGERRTPLFSW